MKMEIIWNGECVGRVSAFGGRTDVIFTPKETALFTSLTPIRTALQAAAAQREGGNRSYREHANERSLAALATRTLMRDIAEIAKALAERGVDVGAADAFRMPPHTSYAKLAAVARSFHDLVEDRAALFADLGLSATFVADLAALIATLRASGDTTGTERARQVGGTAGLEEQANAGMAIVRELRSMMRVKFRNQPAMLAEWSSLSRVQSRARDTEIEPSADPFTPPSTGGDGPLPGSGS